VTAQLEILGEVFLAMILGGVIGWEREAADKPAGLRTHMLVAGAAALLVGLGSAIVQTFVGSHNDELLTFDPIRLIEATVTAVGFFGAGTIFKKKDEEQISGLTTAASMLLAATIGVSVASRQFALAIGVTVLTLVTLRGILWAEKRIGPGERKSASGS
jgi:putative Mg2+ transporter-C (MgtC) family protein